LVDSLIATAASEKILRDFKPSNVEFPLAIHLSGKFKTAFPDGPPASSSRDSQLKESSNNGEIVIVSDSDMLNDNVCIRVQNVMGRPTPQAANGNLNFVQSLVERLAGDEDLISSRSRASISRPFTRVKEMESRAGKQWQQKIRVLETRQRETDQKIKQLQAHNENGGNQSVILSPAQEVELEKYQKGLVEVSRDLKQVRKNLRRETEALEFWTKVLNIGTMPLVVAVSGLVLAFIKARRRAPQATVEPPRPRTPSARNTVVTEPTELVPF
jgi:ABC-type uncharacterized transport system involved in gliding motility auxiliary subunit